MPGGRHAPVYSFGEQTRLAPENVLAVLKQAGTSREPVLKVTAYIVGIENWGAFNSVYAEVFGPTKPAHTVVPVAELHFGCLLEVDAIACLPNPATK